MPVETLQRPPEQAKRPVHLVVLHPGAGGDYPGVSSMDSQLKRLVGSEGDVFVRKSVLLAGHPDADRENKEVEVVAAQVEEGNNVVYISHSFGAPQSANPWERFKKRLSAKWQTLKDQIDSYLISPAIPQNRRRALLYALKAAKMYVQEFSVLPFQLPGKSRGYRSINAFTSILPEDFAEKKDIYIEGVRKAYPRLSRMAGSENVIPFDPDPERKYLSNITIFDREKREKVRALDNRIAFAMEKGKSFRTRWLLRKRAKLIRSELNKTYEGKFVKNVGDEPIKTPPFVKTEEGKRLRRKIVFDMFFRGKAFRQYLERVKAGEKITIIRPEFDILDRRKEINALVSAGKNVVVKIAEFATHAAPWAVQPGILRRVLGLPATA